MVKGFFDKKTQEKTILLGEDYIEELKKHIDMDVFPKALGGNFEHNLTSDNWSEINPGPWNNP